ncbi:MAG TPA: DUF1206 domain-containing protein [Allosphingosinicella sp.]|nr:DUF1206 domain-containing protein [Allosphingosinicella sp.]
MQASKFQAFTRVGFAARGIMYILIGFLALKFGRTQGSGGALEYLGSGAGQALLLAMALGFLAYGLWRLSEAVIDTEGHGDDTKGKVIRAAGLVSGVVHLGLALYALRLGLGGAGGSSGAPNGAEQGAATTLALPGGQTLLMVAAAILLGAGLYQFVKAAKLGFLRHLDERACRAAWVRWVGRLGYAARGAVFLIVAYSLWTAARQDSAQQAEGTGEALGSLPPTMQAAVAVGLALFGIFSLVEARYRRINDPQVLERLGARR